MDRWRIMKQMGTLNTLSGTSLEQQDLYPRYKHYVGVLREERREAYGELLGSPDTMIMDPQVDGDFPITLSPEAFTPWWESLDPELRTSLQQQFSVCDVPVTEEDHAAFRALLDQHNSNA